MTDRKLNTYIYKTIMNDYNDVICQYFKQTCVDVTNIACKYFTKTLYANGAVECIYCTFVLGYAICLCIYIKIFV